jgi:hypothetical protein
MLTVVMATRNRAGVLHRVLDSFAALEIPRGGWKLVIVDNASTDATPEVLRNSRLTSQGHLGWFLPQAGVRHIIRPEQLTQRWILDRAYRNGLGVGLTCAPDCTKGPRLKGIPAALLLRLIAYGSLAMFVRPLPPSALRLQLLFRDSWFRGLADSLQEITSPIRPATSNTMQAETQTPLAL